MEIIIDILKVIQILFFIYIIISVGVLFVFSFAGIFSYKPLLTDDGVIRKIAVIIPAYREDTVILEVVESAMEQQYPKDKFDIVVVADHFKKETLDRLSKQDIILLAKDFDISTKSRAINFAFRHLKNSYDIACILDADNIMSRDFLLTINKSFATGFKVVQGHRTAKNLNTNFALLDAISEEINNSIFRKGFRRLNFSSALIGSAMAFDYKMFKKMMAEVEVVGGFDKEIEMRLARRKIKVEYLPEPYVYDEKVQNSEVFTRQRRRWLSAQVHFFGSNLLPSIKSLFSKGNFEYFVRAMIYLQLPRILLFAVLIILVPLSFFVNPIGWIIAWCLALVLLILVFVFAIPLRFYNFNFFKAVLTLPKGILMMMVSLLSVKKGNKKFIHTKHTYNAFQIKKHKH